MNKLSIIGIILGILLLIGTITIFLPIFPYTATQISYTTQITDGTETYYEQEPYYEEECNNERVNTGEFLIDIVNKVTKKDTQEICKTITKYKSVPRTKTIQKNQEKKIETKIIKHASLIQFWTKNIIYYYEI